MIRLILALLLVTSTCFAGQGMGPGPGMITCQVTHGTVTYSTPGTYYWPSTTYSNCSLPVTATVNGGGGGGGYGEFYQGAGSVGGFSSVSSTEGSLTANGGTGGTYTNVPPMSPSTASGGTTGTSGTVSAVTPTTGGGALGGDPDNTYWAQYGGPGGKIIGTITGAFSPSHQITVVVGLGGSSSHATAGSPGSVTLNW